MPYVNIRIAGSLSREQKQKTWTDRQRLPGKEALLQVVEIRQSIAEQQPKRRWGGTNPLSRFLRIGKQVF